MKGIDASNYYHQISLGNLSLGNLIPTTVRCFFFFFWSDFIHESD